MKIAEESRVKERRGRRTRWRVAADWTWAPTRGSARGCEVACFVSWGRGAHVGQQAELALGRVGWEGRVWGKVGGSVQVTGIWAPKDALGIAP